LGKQSAVERKEVVAVLPKVVSVAKQADVAVGKLLDAMDVFIAMDFNHDGKMTEQELKTELRRIGCEDLADADIVHLNAGCDEDGDGKVDVREWKDALMSYYGRLHAQRAKYQHQQHQSRHPHFVKLKEQAKRQGETQAKKEAEEQARKEAEEQAGKEQAGEEQAGKEAEEQAGKEAEEQAAKKEAEEQAGKEAEEQAGKEQAGKEAEEQMRKEAEDEEIEGVLREAENQRAREKEQAKHEIESHQQVQDGTKAAATAAVKAAIKERDRTKLEEAIDRHWEIVADEEDADYVAAMHVLEFLAAIPEDDAREQEQQREEEWQEEKTRRVAEEEEEAKRVEEEEEEARRVAEEEEEEEARRVAEEEEARRVAEEEEEEEARRVAEEEEEEEARLATDAKPSILQAHSSQSKGKPPRPSSPDYNSHIFGVDDDCDSAALGSVGMLFVQLATPPRKKKARPKAPHTVHKMGGAQAHGEEGGVPAVVSSLVAKMEEYCNERSAERKTRLVDAFRHFDSNHDGIISAEEMRRCLRVRASLLRARVPL
jgi:Ca2+-binding EF-hand superfamily protein